MKSIISFAVWAVIGIAAVAGFEVGLKTYEVRASIIEANNEQYWIIKHGCGSGDINCHLAHITAHLTAATLPAAFAERTTLLAGGPKLIINGNDADGSHLIRRSGDVTVVGLNGTGDRCIVDQRPEERELVL